jgi:hypothetical protein
VGGLCGPSAAASYSLGRSGTYNNAFTNARPANRPHFLVSVHFKARAFTVVVQKPPARCHQATAAQGLSAGERRCPRSPPRRTWRTKVRLPREELRPASRVLASCVGDVPVPCCIRFGRSLTVGPLLRSLPAPSARSARGCLCRSDYLRRALRAADCASAASHNVHHHGEGVAFCM